MVRLVQGACPCDPGIEVERVFQAALKGPIVNIDQAKSLAVAVRPFKIVEQRPYEIPMHRDAGCDCFEHGAKIVAKIRDPLRVAHSTIGIESISEGGTILGYVNRQATVSFLDLEELDPKCIRSYLPAHLRDRPSAWRRQLADAKEMPGIADDAGRFVMVKGEVIERLVYD